MGKVEVHALNGVTLQIRRGEFVSVTGPSGSGKTTLLNMIGLLDDPTNGTVTIDGEDTRRLSAREKSEFRLQRLGFIFQFFNLFMELTAIENIILPSLALGTSRGNYTTKAATLLKTVGLEKRVRHYPYELSGGEQQRVAIARALMNNPVLVLTDEPTANIDSVMSNKIVDLFVRINRERGVTIFMATHEKELASKATRTIELRDGEIVSDRPQ
jgi:ABC-type lipoprotein export system ATPase subunit